MRQIQLGRILVNKQRAGRWAAGLGAVVFFLMAVQLQAQRGQEQWSGSGFPVRSTAGVQPRISENLPTETEQLFALANQARSENGLKPLRLDRALSQAALTHCRTMAYQGAIGHRFNGEPDLGQRVQAAGAHFNVVEENVASGPTAWSMHNGWMHSPGHRANLLSPEVDRVGIAVVESAGMLYSVADYDHAVEVLDHNEAEAAIAQMLTRRGLAVRAGTESAQTACRTDHGIPRPEEAAGTTFVMRWQEAELDKLPDPLLRKIATRQFHKAEVATCPAAAQGSFTVYRMAVLLY